MAIFPKKTQLAISRMSRKWPFSSMVYLLIAWWIFPWRTVSHNQMVIMVNTIPTYSDYNWIITLWYINSSTRAVV